MNKESRENNSHSILDGRSAIQEPPSTAIVTAIVIGDEHVTPGDHFMKLFVGNFDRQML